MLPLGLIPPRAASAAQFFLMLGCLAYLILFVRGKCLSLGLGKSESLVIGMLSILAIAVPILQDFCSQNWMVILLAAAALMTACLNMGSRRGDIMAGICWAVLMIKPQTGLLFAVPLLMRRKFTTCATAVLTCIIMSIPPSIMCGTSPIELIFVTPGSNSAQFWGCGTFPSFLTELIPQNAAIMVGLAVGVGICVAMTRLLSNHDDWLFMLMPAAVCSMYWTYARCYSHVMGWFFFACISFAIIRRPSSRLLWALLALAIPTMSRLYNALHFAAVHLKISPFCDTAWTNGMFPLIDTLHSALGLVIAIAFCLAIRGQTAPPRIARA